MTADAVRAVRAEIDKLETEVSALRDALSLLGGAAARSASNKRRPKTAAEKAVLSRKLKAAWRRRRKAQR